MIPTQDTFQTRLRSWRTALRWSQETAAAHLGVTYASLRKWEAGDRHPDSFKEQALEQVMAALTKEHGGEQ